MSFYQSLGGLRGMIPDKRIIELAENSKSPMIRSFNKNKSLCLNESITCGLLSYTYQPTVESIKINGQEVRLLDVLDSRGKLQIPARARITFESQETFHLPNNIMTVVMPINNRDEFELISQTKVYHNGTQFTTSLTYFNLSDDSVAWNPDSSLPDKSFCHMLFFENIAPLLDDSYQPIYGL